MARRGEVTDRRGSAELRGCIPILCTPFFEDGSLDLASLAREIDYVIGEGAEGVAALFLEGVRT